MAILHLRFLMEYLINYSVLEIILDVNPYFIITIKMNLAWLRCFYKGCVTEEEWRECIEKEANAVLPR